MKRILLILVLAANIGLVFAQGWSNANLISGKGQVIPSNLVVDDLNNVYITGKFTDSLYSEFGDIKNHGGFDIFLSKFDENLNPLWVKTFGSDNDEGGSIVSITDDGQIVITGDFAGTKFIVQDGDTIYNGGISGTKNSFVVVLESSGVVTNYYNLYSSTENFYPITSTTNGNKLITVNKFAGTVNLNGNEYISQNSDEDLLIIEGGLSGTFEKVKHIILQGAAKVGEVRVKNSEYYFAGDFSDSIRINDFKLKSTGGTELFAFKLDHVFKMNWFRQGHGSGTDVTGTVTADEYENLYFAGYFKSPDMQFDSTENINSSVLNYNALNDIFIVGYNKNGSLLWKKGIGSAKNDRIFNLSHKNDIIFSTGYYGDDILFDNKSLTGKASGKFSFFISLFDLNGNVISVDTNTPQEDGNEIGSYMVFGDNQSAYVIGYFNSDSIHFGDIKLGNRSALATGNNTFIAKYIVPLSIALTDSVRPSCNGEADGELVAKAYFGQAPYSYNWYNMDVNPTQSISTNDTLSSLAAGNYRAIVTDNLGDKDTVDVTLTEPEILAVIGTPTDALCYEGNNAAIDITVSGGTGAKEYTWSGLTPGASGVVSDAEDQTTLTAGTYRVVINDANGCAVQDDYTVGQATPIYFNAVVVDDTDATKGIGDGSITLSPSGGNNASYLYDWDEDDAFDDGNSRSSLDGGYYFIKVRDANSCEVDTSIFVSQPSLQVEVQSLTNVDCFGNTNGSISVSAVNTTGVITYVWKNHSDGSVLSGETSNTISGLAPGTYRIVITDDMGTSGVPGDDEQDSTYVEITQPAAALTIADANVTNMACFGDTDGFIDIAVTGGTLPYSFSWSNTAETEDISGLTADTYSVTITDKNGCQTSDSYDIVEPSELQISTNLDQALACFGDRDAIISVNATGGTPATEGDAYTYQWNDPARQTSAIADDIYPGSYKVTVSDSLGCKKIGNITVNEPSAISITETLFQIRCNGADNGSITLDVSGGTPGNPDAYSYDWSNGETVDDIFGLAAGDYQVKVTDGNSCQDSATYTITEPTALNLVLDSKTDNTCFGETNGEVVVTASGGLSGQYEYSIDEGTSWQTTNTFAELASGDYNVWLRDKNETTCIYDALEPVSILPEQIQISTEVTNISCEEASNGTITVTASHPDGIDQYSIDNTNWQDENVFSGLNQGTYKVYVRNTTLCVDSAEAIIGVDESTLDISELTASHADLTCFEANNGAFAIEATGGQSAYEYKIDNGDWGTAVSFTGQLPGTYKAYVRDANNCSDSVEITITEPEVVDLTEVTSSHDNISCFGLTDGSIELEATGGDGTFEYKSETGDWVSTATFSSLSPGTVKYYTRDGNLCLDSLEINITEPTDITIEENVGQHVDVLCKGENTGRLAVTADGGIGTLQYSIDGEFYQFSATFNDILADSYRVYVKDNNDCLDSVDVVITEPAEELSVDYAASRDSTKELGGQQIYIVANGGVEPYMYSLNNGTSYQSSPIFSGVTGDQAYLALVRDENQCVFQLDDLELDELISLDVETIAGMASIKVYPNPAKSEVFIDIPSSLESNEIMLQVFGQDGQLMEQHKYNSPRKYIKLNISEYNDGVYIVKISGENFSTQTKIIKQ